MTKKIWLVILWIFVMFLSACTQKFYLDEQYYNQGNFIKITSNDFENLDSQNYILFTYNNYCAFSVPCDEIFQHFMSENKIDFLSISYEEFKKTKLHEIVDFAPSVIIVRNWKVVDYLDSEKDKYLDMYQDVAKFWEWLGKYVNLNPEK